MKTFLISDTHFYHGNILKFETAEGVKLRTFPNIHHMNEYIIDRWNFYVKPTDKVYHLGDVGFFNQTQLNEIFSRLNGTKILIKGNHDDYIKPARFLEHFKDIRAYHVLDKILLAHIPVHPSSLTRWRGQVHGHIHNKVMDDPRYYNVCVERTDYCPIDFEVIREYYKNLETNEDSS